ncbi:hypothetical protein O181_085667, partial [Austropuccinia psidii MF-1]|nr:hypothetical protein [Austropuccinia psidii MF-1]
MPQTTSPTALLSSVEEPHKIVYYCTKGKHNMKCVTHKKEDCWSENPHLRPLRREKKRRHFDATAHLTVAQALVTTSVPSQPKVNQLILDCGATHHMFNYLEPFLNTPRSTSIHVGTGDTNSKLSAVGIGTVKILNHNNTLTLKECLYVPNLKCNLISLLELFKEQLTLNRKGDVFSLNSNGKEIMHGKIINKLMVINYTILKTLLTNQIDNLWHNRLGHPAATILKQLGLPTPQDNCVVCETNKAHKKPFNNHFEPAFSTLDCVHMDVVGPINPASVSGKRYFLTIVDQSSSFKIVKFLQKKSEVFENFQAVKITMENTQEKKLKKLVSDRGGEFLNNNFKELLNKCGFTHIFAPPETPQHNAFAERANQTILEKARCLLGKSNLPANFWADAVNTAVLLSNLSPTASRGNLSPHFLWTGTPAKLSRLRTFGCRAVVYNLSRQIRWKLDPPGQPGIFIGYKNNNTAYWILWLNDLKVSIAHHATFNEKVFLSISQKTICDTFTVPNEEITPYDNSQTIALHEQTEAELSPELVDEIQLEERTAVTSAQEEGDDSTINQAHAPRLKIIGPRHPTLITADLNNLNILPYKRRPIALLTTSNDTPQTYCCALKSEDRLLWQEAINKELKSMHLLNVWDVVELHKDYKLVGTTWVFKIKRDELNKPIEYKACLCAQGFTQSMGVDFNKTYAPMGHLNFLRTLTAFACVNKLQFHQINIRSAFLNAELSETVYLAVPQGMQLDKKKFCLRLNKEIYGLRQAPLAWYERLKNWLILAKFSVCTLDPCVFYRAGSTPVWLYVHADNIGIFSKDVSLFKAEIGKEFNIKNIGEADLMLGIKIQQTENGISLDQQHFTEALLEQYGMEACKAMTTPLTPNKHLCPATDEELAAFKKIKMNYRSAIGSINYLSTATRPDLSFAVSTLSQYLERPGIKHWQAFLHVLKYLRGSFDRGLYYPADKSNGVTAFSNADWEAEYKAVCDLTSELLWFRQWCKEAKLFAFTEPILIFEDNQSCIKTANGDCNLNNKRMKNVNIQLNFIKEAIQNDLIRLHYTPSTEMLADFLTKSVNRTSLENSLRALNLLQLG